MSKESKEAIVAKNVWNPQFADWINSQQDKTIVSLGKPDENVDYDIAISRKNSFDSQGAKVKILRESEYNEQVKWMDAGKRLSNWGKSPFHLNNEIVMATWLLGKSGHKAITFFDVTAKQFISSRNGEDQFLKAMKKLISEFETAIRYTHTESSLFSLIGKPKTAEKNEVKIESTEIPTCSELFENRNSKVKVGQSEMLSVSKRKRGGVINLSGGSVPSREFFIYKSPVEKVSQNRVLLPNNDKVIAETVRTYGNEKEIYVISNEVFDSIKSLKAKFSVSTLSPSTMGFLAFAMSETFDYIKTDGLIHSVSKNESQLLQSVAKNKNIRHV